MWRRTAKALPHVCFLSHDWGMDEDGRDNHARVARVAAALRPLGVVAWLDEQEMRGDVNSKMAEGIDGSSTFVVFITKNYLYKVTGRGINGENDNCKFEFDFALRKKGVERIITCVMERRCLKAGDWPGVINGKLCCRLYIDLSRDGVPFEDGVRRLAGEVYITQAHPVPSLQAIGPHEQLMSTGGAPMHGVPDFDRKDIQRMRSNQSNDFTGACLNGVDLSKLNLAHVRFKGAALADTSFEAASLAQANLQGVDLQRANLVRADLRGADLTKADMRCADLRGADLSSAILTGADLRRALLDPVPSVSHANLVGANLAGHDLREFPFTCGVLLTGINLKGANLKGAQLTAGSMTVTTATI
jgi:uncharacterized protein YjbI with pentapeptide repeats